MNDKQSIPYYSDAELSALDISAHDIIECIETLIRKLGDSVWTAPKSVILPGDGRYLMSTLSAANDPNILAVKSLVLNPANLDRGLEQINGLITLLDSETGLPIAILDANWITATRTAGLSATAAKYLAKKNSRVAAFIGCGVQATSHLHLFCEMFPLKEVKLFGRGQANIDKMCVDAKQRGLTANICESGSDALAGADLVVSSVTYSSDFQAFLNADHLEPGAFAAVTDLAAPWDKNSFGLIDHVVIDDLQQEAALPNKLLSPSDISGDLAGLVLGDINGRQTDADRTAFVFRGHALGDLALSLLSYRRLSSSPG